ncbi:MAG: metalloregulator ArsR/SmtB family transcription factor [Pseudomonadota bacterium]
MPLDTPANAGILEFMNYRSETDALSALGHPGRLSVFRLLARRAPGGVRPSDLAEALAMAPSSLAAHLSALQRAGLVLHARDGRVVTYRLDLTRTAGLIDFLVNDCCRGRPDLVAPLAASPMSPVKEGQRPMSDQLFKVLFICTRNSARSIFAEAILNKEGAGKFQGFSAGTQAGSSLNPHAIELLQRMGHDTSPLRSKHVSEFQGPDAPQMDFVFTVCDRAANEDCPPWQGQPLSAHWGLPDPVKAAGVESEKGLAFLQAYRTLYHRLQGFLALPVATLDRISLQRRLDDLGQQSPPAA